MTKSRSFINFLSLAVLAVLLDSALINFARHSVSVSNLPVQALSSGAAPAPTETPNQQAATQQRTALRAFLPIQEESFSLDYDYQQLVFVVTLFEPRDTSRLAFSDWLSTHGFTDIEPEKFVYLP